MSDHFSIDASPTDLSAAERVLGEIGRQLSDEGGKLAGLPGQAGDWTGSTAVALKGEMTRVGGQMTASTPHFETATTALATFRTAVEEATTDTIPGLNKQWGDAITEHQNAVGAANRAHADRMSPYRNMPDEDTRGVRGSSAATRDTAVTDADEALTTSQRSLTREYDQCVSDLQQAARACGQALAGAVLAAVPAEVVSDYLAGGGTGTRPPSGFDLDDVTTATRQTLTGDTSITGQADDYAAGRRTAEQAAQWWKDHPHERMPPDLREELAAGATNPAFVQGLMVTAGSSGMARLSVEAARLHNDRDPDADEFFTVLADIYRTGSHVRVDDGEGGSRYLMDEDWLNAFNPIAADPELEDGEERSYRPDLLLPFMREPGFSENFTGLVADRALSDYEKHWMNEDTRDFTKFQHYLGNCAGQGWGCVAHADPDDPWGPNFQIALDRAGDYPTVANSMLLRHRDAVMYLATGNDPPWTGGEGAGVDYPDRAGGALADILRQGTIGLVDQDPRQAVNADVAAGTVAEWLQRNGDAHLVDPVNGALTDVLLHERYLNGMANSLGTPFAPDSGVISDPAYGPLMSRDAWARLHQEAMRDPDNAARVVTTLGDWINRTNADAQSAGYSANGPGGPLTQDPSVSALDRFRAEAVRSFLAGNLTADLDVLQSELERGLADNENAKETAKGVLTTLLGYATDPTSIKDDLIGKGGEFIIGTAVDAVATDPQAITDRYQPTLDALNTLSTGPIVDPSVWDDVNTTATTLAKDEARGTGADDIWAVQPGYDAGNPPRPTAYDGDPRSYVGHTSDYVGGNQPVITDDFLEYDDAGHVTGVKEVDTMNHLQRSAYMSWLQDPAVQRYLNQADHAVQEARERAGR
ncbi:MAG: hypothetical protein ACRC35_04255 [Angustibacter sp.]